MARAANVDFVVWRVGTDNESPGGPSAWPQDSRPAEADRKRSRWNVRPPNRPIPPASAPAAAPIAASRTPAGGKSADDGPAGCTDPRPLANRRVTRSKANANHRHPACRQGQFGKKVVHKRPVVSALAGQASNARGSDHGWETGFQVQRVRITVMNNVHNLRGLLKRCLMTKTW